MPPLTVVIEGIISMISSLLVLDDRRYPNCGKAHSLNVIKLIYCRTPKHEE
jgi:hypothetical protein